VFFSSHILEQVEAVCDRVGILREGSIVAEDTIEGLREAAGSGTTLRVTVDEVTEAALSQVEDLDGVTEVSHDGNRIAVTTQGGAKTAVLDALESTGATVRDFSTEETSLEELFAAYTEGGRSQ
jgi:ABC-2 type transport system ATP-binding protein